MKILITGGAGFIGSHLARKLLNKGETVVVIDNFDPFYPASEKRKNISDLVKNRKFKLIKADIQEGSRIKNIFKKEKFDYVIHLAAKAGVRPSMLNPKAYIKTNILGTLNLLESSKENRVKNFIFGSSSSVYGERSKVPFSEKDKTDSPISPYGFTKLAGEKLCFVYHHLYGLPVICLRFFTVYGPAQRPDLAIRIFIKLISKGKPVDMYGDGSTTRDYTFIDDIVDGIARSYKKKMDFEIINLGNSSPVRLKDLIRLIGEKLDKDPKINRLPRQKGDVSKTYADISKARLFLNWSPKTKIDSGLGKMIEWYRSNPV
ncbi:MAG TPA: SDR family NAD(P)-dependent oxidoreductase [Patescibacteria group bacterium]|nr:SDR family NAD(P)-dependent oxidoreductase [Patescibacteria group bacterium]